MSHDVTSKRNRIEEELQLIDQRVGERLALLRRRAGFSQKDVAEKLGCTYQQVQKYETGRNRLSVGRLMVLAEWLKVPVGVLVAEGGKASETVNRWLQDVSPLDALTPRKRAFALEVVRLVREL